MENKDELYLTVKELSEKIKFSRQTIYNMIHNGDFVKGQHYIKPRPKKVLSRQNENVLNSQSRNVLLQGYNFPLTEGGNYGGKGHYRYEH